MTKTAAFLTVSIFALITAQPVLAGFEFVAPVAEKQAPAAADTDVMPPVDSTPPVAAAPVPVVTVAPETAMPTPVAAALKDLPVRAPASAAPVADMPVVTSVPAPVAATSTAVARNEPLVAQQNRTTAVYPPPGNAAAAPLARNAVSETGLKMPTPIVQSAPVAVAEPEKEQIIWNETVSAVPSSVVMDEPTVPANPTGTEQPAPVSVNPAPATSVPSRQDFAAINGFGDTIPLPVALDQIVPKDYQVVYQDKPDPATLVSWSGGRPWNEVLSDMLYAHGYRAVVRDKTVTVMKAGKLSAAPAVSDITPAAGSAAKAMTVQPNNVAVPAAVTAKSTVTKTGFDATKADIFSARAGDSVQDVLARWADQAKVQMYWTADQNYRLPEAVAYNATFAVAVTRLLDTFANNANRPVAKLHPNLPEGPAVLSVENVKSQTVTLK